MCARCVPVHLRPPVLRKVQVRVVAEGQVYHRVARQQGIDPLGGEHLAQAHARLGQQPRASEHLGRRVRRREGMRVRRIALALGPPLLCLSFRLEPHSRSLCRCRSFRLEPRSRSFTRRSRSLKPREPCGGRLTGLLGSGRGGSTVVQAQAPCRMRGLRPMQRDGREAHVVDQHDQYEGRRPCQEP